jgi:hypothetical protein
MNALAQCHPNVNAPLFKRVSSDRGEHLLVVPHSRIYDLPPDLAARFDAGDSEAIHLAEALAQTAAGEDPLEEIPEPEPQSISLNVSSSCSAEPHARVDRSPRKNRPAMAARSKKDRTVLTRRGRSPAEHALVLDAVLVRTTVAR